MLRRAFNFGRRTIGAIQVLLQAGHENALFACILCRPCYEAALRVLWASRTPEGWQRLQSYYADQDRKWAQEAQNIPSVSVIARKTLANSQEILKRTHDNGKKFPPAPNIEQTLREIEQQDVQQNLREADSTSAAFDYTNVYRFLSQAVHGHMSVIGQMKSSAFLRHATMTPVMVTSLLLQACCHIATCDPKKEIELAAKKIVELLK